MAMQLIVDLYGCDHALLDDETLVRETARKAVASIGADIVEECLHKFQPIGVSYIAVITTSHFSVHTWPECGYAAVDVFSCAEGIPAQLADALAEAFAAEHKTVRSIERQIPEGGDST